MLKIDNKILGYMQDDLSKEIYKKRIDFNNGNSRALEDIILTVRGGKQLKDFMEANKNHLYIFGAGILGKELFEAWKWKYSFCGFIDNDKRKQGKSMGGVPIIGLDEIAPKDRKSVSIIIANKFYGDDIETQLRKENFCCENIFQFGKARIRLNRLQYFDLEELDKSCKERFVDCGAFDGKTSMYMYEWYKNNVDKIWMFEPDKTVAERCRENFKTTGFQNYEVIEKAVYSTKTQLSFTSTGDGSASLNSEGNIIVDTVSLDEIIGEESPSFIKMDVEGAELEALKGAKEIIQTYKPKLAICVYHKYEDLDEIPRLLLEYNPDYHFYLRHYSLVMTETVLYAL